jgi:hypothetical protein
MSNSGKDSEHSDQDEGAEVEGHHHHEETHESDELHSLGPAIEIARSGLLSDVLVLVEAREHCHVYIPLSEDLPDTPDGQRIEMNEELTFRPHMILNQDESIFAVAYSEPKLVDAMQSALGWETSKGELKFVCVPTQVALDLAQTDVDGDPLSGLVFNPGTDQELILQRDEVASIAQGTAIPLVGYVSSMEDNTEAETQVLEGAAPPPAQLLEALDLAKERHADLVAVKVQTTFNPERDREPHLSITLTVVPRDSLDRQALADAIMEDAAPHLPAPGYADIVFRDAPN